MQDQKTYDDAPTASFMRPAPTKSASAKGTVTVRPSATLRATKAPLPAPSPEQAQAIWRELQYTTEINVLKEQLRAEKEAAKHIQNDLAVFLGAHFVYSFIVVALSAIAFGFFGYIGMKIAARLVGPLRIRNASPPLRPNETITSTHTGPP